MDGSDVILQQQNGDRWTVPVPLDEDGEYIVEIIAEDDAGNQSYVAKMLFVVNKAMIKSYMLSLDYIAELINTWAAYIINKDYYSDILPALGAYCIDSPYQAVALPCI